MDRITFWARLADAPLWLEVRSFYTKQLFEAYKIAPDAADRQQYAVLMQSAGWDAARPIAVSGEELQKERSLSEQGELAPEDYLESLALYRKLCGLLLARDVLLFHSSALELDGRAYLFTAPSGTGKSTHARLWRQVFGNRVTMINDDKPLLRRQPDGSWRVYGTPYSGKEALHTNTSQTVCGIVLLEQAPENRIERVSTRDAFPRLLAQTHQDKQQPQALLRTMDLVGSLAQLPVYRLGCTISEEAVRIAYQALKGETT